MNRRSLLAALAGMSTAATVGTAGCLQSVGSGPDPATTGPRPDDTTDGPPARTTRDDAREKGATDPDWNPAGGPVETFAVGDRDAVAFPDSNQPHAVSFWNRVDREREVAIEVAHGATDGPVRLGPVTVPARYTVEVSLQLPTRYALTVSVDGEDFGTVTVSSRWIDCNYSDSPYALGERDVVAYPETSTTVACADPTIAATTLDVEDRGCATDDDPNATIAYDGERVRVDGTFVASNPCHELTVEEASYSDETRTATVVVDATHPEDQACQDCVGAIDYRATIDFENDLPDHVSVLHRDANGNDVRVAVATRNDGA